jgi:ribonuclease T1
MSIVITLSGRSAPRSTATSETFLSFAAPENCGRTTTVERVGPTTTSHTLATHSPARAIGAFVAVASVLLGVVNVTSASALPSPTFDWPLGCTATVAQRYTNPNLTVDVTYEVELADIDSVPGVIAVEFGPATVDDIGDDVSNAQRQQIGAYFTNPTIEVDAGGSPVEAVGFEEWFEQFEAAGSTGADEVQLEREIGRRATITWESWVGTWTTMAEFDGEIVVEPAGDGHTTYLAERNSGDRVISVELLADEATLTPVEASYSVRPADDPDAIVFAYDWWFEWPSCDTSRSVGDLSGGSTALVGFDTITLAELPPEALDTLALIEAGGPFPYHQDGAVFENREGLLPDQEYGYYQEYTVETPGSDDRGARRLVAGANGELFYTDDHYDSFRVVVS